jgi:hypothetical protein
MTSPSNEMILAQGDSAAKKPAGLGRRSYSKSPDIEPKVGVFAIVLERRLV